MRGLNLASTFSGATDSGKPATVNSTLTPNYCYYTLYTLLSAFYSRPKPADSRQCQPTPLLPRASSSHHLHGVVQPIRPRCAQKRSGCGTSAPTPRRMRSRGRSESRRATSKTLTLSSATPSHPFGQRKYSASLSPTTTNGTSLPKMMPCSSGSSPQDTLPSFSALASSQRFVHIFLQFMARPWALSVRVACRSLFRALC